MRHTITKKRHKKDNQCIFMCTYNMMHISPITLKCKCAIHFYECAVCGESSNYPLLYSWMFGKHCRLVFIWPQTCASEVWTQQKAGSESLLALRVLAAPTIPLAGEPPHTHIPPDVKRANKHQRPWRAQSEPMKSSLLSRHADMKGAMSAETERQSLVLFPAAVSFQNRNFLRDI